MKHIVNKSLAGSITIEKSSIIDISEMIRMYPLATRVLLLLSNYADKNNTLITNEKTISYLIGEPIKQVKSALHKLDRECFIEMKYVKINHSCNIVKYYHDKDKYRKSKKTIWEVRDSQIVDEYTLKNTYLYININKKVIDCSKNTNNNFLSQAKGNLFYDTNITTDELIWRE